MSSLRQWWQMNTDILELKDAYFRNKKNVTWNWADPTNLHPIYWDNPYWTRYQNYEEDNRTRYFGFTQLDWKIADWIDIMGRASMAKNPAK
jgi:hypothetical protein